MKKLFLAPVLGLALVACGNTSNQNQADSTAVDSAQVEPTAATTIEATYQGILPGADNSGFDTVLELKADASFLKIQTAEGHTDSIMGTYTIVGDTLTLTTDTQDFALLQGDSISLLDADKKVPAIPYILRKK